MLDSMRDYEEELSATEELEEGGVATTSQSVGVFIPGVGSVIGAAAGAFTFLNPVRDAVRASRGRGPTPARPDSSRPDLHSLDDGTIDQLVQLAAFEMLLEKQDGLSNCGQLLLLQGVRAEHILRDAFLDPEAACRVRIVTEHDRPGAREILEGYFAGKLKPTLGIVELFLVGLRRSLGRGDPDAATWVERRFAASVTRYPGERVPVKDALAGRQLAGFIGWFREVHRNKLAHSADDSRVSRKDYEEWCDRAYGCTSLRTWLERGIDPKAHRPSDVGWVSFAGAVSPGHRGG